MYDRIISLRVKEKVYNTVVRPALMYGAETWAVKKAQEKKLDVAEMRMSRWIVESPSWTELGMKALEGQRRLDKYPRKCRKIG